MLAESDFIPMIGARFGHYRILDKIGEGGMGTVYSAQDEHLARNVAIKVMRASSSTDEASRRRFRNEAEALSKLNHPNIQVVYDFDSQDGVDFLAMEYIPGQTLAEKLASGPLPEKEISRLGAQFAAGLTAAHNRGILHRDLKPGNIRITPDGQLKILDFGLATFLRPANVEGTTESLLQTLAGAGTLPYMSPEQLRAEPTDPRSDLFSFGAVLYEMATSRRPFDERIPSRLIDAILHQHLVSPRALNPRISLELERIILKCQQKDPADRYQSAGEVEVDLRALGGVPLPPFVPGSRSRKLPDNFRHKILLASIAALVLSAGIVVKLALFRQHPRVPTGKAAITSLAVLPLENFSRDPEQEYFTDGMTEALTTNLAQISALRVISRTSALRYRGTSKPMPQIAHELGVDGIVEGSVERSGDRVRISAQLIEATSDRHLWAKSYEGNLGDILSLQDDVARAIAREIEVRLTPSEKIQLAKARAVDPQAHEAYLKGRYHLNEWTPTENAKAIEYFQQAVNRDPGYALAYAGLADAYISLSAFGMANVAPREAFPRAEAAASKALQINDALSEAHTALAKVKFLYDWDWPGSRREFQRALELNPNDASAHHWYSHFLLSMGQTDQALAEGRRALSIDPLDVEMSLHLVFCYFYTRQFDQAILQARQGLEMDPNFSEFHWFLGEAYEQKGMYREALDELVKATSLSGGRSAVLGGLGHAYAVSGQPVKARIQLRMLQSKTYVSSYDVALVYAGLGEKNQALTWLERAYEEHSDEMVLLNLEPAFDGLRAEPRFRVLADRLHLLS